LKSATKAQDLQKEFYKKEFLDFFLSLLGIFVADFFLCLY